MLSEKNDFRAASHDDADEDIIDLSHYFRVVNQSKWRILSLALVITFLVALIVLSLTPIYKATSSLLIESEETNIVSIEQVYGLDASKKEYFETQYEILKSRYIAEKVVNKLALDSHPIFIEKLDETEMSSPAWLHYLKSLQEKVEHHLADEEQEFFQVAGKVLNERQKEKLADGYREEMAQELTHA